jgi:two-component system sensor histidine kinase CiaH
MEQHWKPFAASDTASKPNMFLKARFKLTALYVVIVAVIIFGFSLFLYQSVRQNLIDSSEEDFAGIESHHHFIQQTLDSIQNEFIFTDLFILLLAAFLSYSLAGRTLEPIQNSVEAQKKFASNASHELRTPLAVMRNDIEVLLRNASPNKEAINATLRSNLEEIQTMSGIIESLLVLARSDNHVALPMSDIDLKQILNGVIGKVKPLADKKGVELTIDDTSIPNTQGNADSMRRAILNVLENGIHHTPRGGSVKVSVEKTKRNVLIKIIDTGSGISPKDLPHVFDRFYKGQSAEGDNMGTGLGLAIVKETVNQHQGTVTIESIEGKGTAVIFALPLA